MKRVIVDIIDDHLAANVAVLASRRGLSLEAYIIWLLRADVSETARCDMEFRHAEQEYEAHMEDADE